MRKNVRRAEADDISKNRDKNITYDSYKKKTQPHSKKIDRNIIPFLPHQCVALTFECKRAGILSFRTMNLDAGECVPRSTNNSEIKKTIFKASSVS